MSATSLLLPLTVQDSGRRRDDVVVKIDDDARANASPHHRHRLLDCVTYHLFSVKKILVVFIIFT